MDPQPQPWRVLEAPHSAPGAEPAQEQAVGRAGPKRPWLTRPVLATIAGAIVVGAAAILVANSSLAGTSVDAGGGIRSSPGSSDADVAGLLVVDVAGAVARPGVYRLAPGARVADALAIAGGFAPRVDAARVAAELNLAALVRDGDRIVVPFRGDAAATSGPAGSGGGAATTGLVDLNKASAEQLDKLPGIGPVTAAKIVAARQDQPFTSVDELLSRKLVGQKTFDKLKPLVTVG